MLEPDEQAELDFEARYVEAVECSKRLSVDTWEAAAVFMETHTVE